MQDGWAKPGLMMWFKNYTKWEQEGFDFGDDKNY